jgi:hypothetical protein
MRSHRWIVALAVVLSSTVVALPAADAAQPCVVTGASGASLVQGARDADGLYAYQSWLVSEGGQAVTQTLLQTQSTVLGIPATARLSDKLQHGLIGYATDHVTHTLVAVVTPEFTGAQALGSALTTARNAIALTLPTAPGVRVQAGCYSAGALIEADSVMSRRTWHPDAAKASFAYALHADDSRFHVVFDERYPAAAQALSDRLGDRVIVDLGTVSRAGRLNDGEPHYGGSGIRKGSNSSLSSNQCTSGFTVKRKSDGKRGVTTAGHCFSNGDSIYSAYQFTGVLWGEGTVDNPFPSIDVAGVMSAAETYANIIHVEPCSPCVRTVTAKGSIGQGSAMCLSGMVTTAICGIIVLSTDATLCDGYGCTFTLVEGWRNNDTIVRAGDSGGPAYVRTGTANATAIGTIVGGAAGRSSSSVTVYVEPIAILEEALSVTVATS